MTYGWNISPQVAAAQKATRQATWKAAPLALAAAALLVTGCGHKARPKAVSNEVNLTTIAVNGWLWRAALETLKFMPIAQSDSAGGVIVGDWYQNPNAPNERMKVTVAILDGNLRADAVQVSATREVLENGQWLAAPVRAGTVQRLEEIILERARTLRQAAMAEY